MNTLNNETETPGLKSGGQSRIMGKLLYLTVGGLLLVSILLGVTYIVKKNRLEAANTDGSNTQELVNVVSLTLKPATIKDRINLHAVVEAWLKFSIMAEVRGRVVQKVVEEGANVNKGDLIAVLDGRTPSQLKGYYTRVNCEVNVRRYVLVAKFSHWVITPVVGGQGSYTSKPRKVGILTVPILSDVRV